MATKDESNEGQGKPPVEMVEQRMKLPPVWIDVVENSTLTSGSEDTPFRMYLRLVSALPNVEDGVGARVARDFQCVLEPESLANCLRDVAASLDAMWSGDADAVVEDASADLGEAPCESST